MKNVILLILSVFVSLGCFAQADKTGILSGDKFLFRNINVKAGLTLSYFHNFTGEYQYILQPDAHVKPEIINKTGAAVSLVILFPLDQKEQWNFLLNIALTDVKEKGTSLFNSQTPFGVGVAYFPFKAKFFGFSLMGNIGRQKVMWDDAVKNQYFPIENYQHLKVNTAVPISTLEDYTHTITTFAINTGIVIRL